MKERPILFSAPMVRAILAGTKTQTRRVMKPQVQQITIKDDCGIVTYAGAALPRKPKGWWLWPNATENVLEICPYGQPGDRLWVRETHAPQADCWAAWEHEMEGYNAGPKPIIHYRADGGDPFIDKWRPAIHMPRFASRINLEITAVRVELLRDISEQDARAEGITDGGCLNCGNTEADCGCLNPKPDARDAFINLWESINGPGSWALNPWVWVIEFGK